ncbi:SLAM family member 9-like [Acipenser ruthenus]|uniref:SLAM family member 9-like n=1 Tax=Acipenser ruthenus TaxID=7906 RepID=UPI0027405D25|nr:SLAM family member 9-like [Acipenser ruthenus]
MSSMKDLLLTVLLHCLISGTGSESNPIDRYGLDGESFHLDVEEYNNLTFRKFVWSKNTKIITEYNLKTQDIDYYKNEEKMEFDKKTFSLLIKKLENTDSGLYRAETVQDDGERIHVVTYKLRVQAAVPKPMINLTETSNANETCIVTLNCSVEYRDDVFIYWEETGINNTKSITNGSFLEYTPVPSAGDEESFTCYAENRVSKNATIIMKNKLTCSQPGLVSNSLWVYIGLSVGIIFLLIIIFIFYFIRQRNRRTGDAKPWPELKPSQTEPKTKLQKRGIARFSNLKVEDSVNTTYASVGETNQSTTTEYDVVRQERMNQPTDLPPDNKTIYASVQKTSIESNCSTTNKKSKIR